MLLSFGVVCVGGEQDLSRKFKREEQRFKELLAQLIDMGNALFGSDNRKVVTLRHYLDEFMNQAWDSPIGSLGQCE